MQPVKKVSASRKKYFFIILLGFGLTILGTKAFSQTPPQGPPPPPPPPGEILNRINPFKKKNKDKTAKDSAKTPSPTVAPAGPPPPPNPLNLFRKKKKDTTKTSPPVKSTR